MNAEMITAAGLGFGTPGDPLFFTLHGVQTRGAFLAAARRWAARLDGDGPVINLCASRDRFAQTLVAAALRGRHCVLPQDAAPASLRSLVAAYPQSCIVSESAPSVPGLPWQMPPEDNADEADQAEHPLLASIPAAQLAAVVYTSGSTGQAQPNPKTWGALTGGAAALRHRLLAELTSASLVATVPPQHMFGLEVTILLPLCSAAAVDAGKPFFPADVADVLKRVPPPRVLVTTPVHLRALLASGVALPPLASIVSATAPLPHALAEQAQQRYGAVVREIYGSTETGAVASREPVQTERWTPLPNVCFQTDAEGARVSAAHLPTRVLLHDQLKIEADGRFELIGRSSDLLKVSGKRMSSADLTRRLLDIPGVIDAVVVVPERDDVVGRPAALVVAPELSEAAILDALAAQVDPVFLPRPLRRVDALPRNAVGKLPRERVLELLRE